MCNLQRYLTYPKVVSQVQKIPCLQGVVCPHAKDRGNGLQKWTLAANTLLSFRGHPVRRNCTRLVRLRVGTTRAWRRQ
jgi:hypothetical protein